MKKINTDSKTYKIIRGAVEITSNIGAGIASEAVIIPYSCLLFKHRITKNVSFFGTWVMACMIGDKVSKWIVNEMDGFVSDWNDIADYVNAKKQPPIDISADIDEEIVEEDESPSIPGKPLDETIRKMNDTDLVSFDTFEEAEQVVTKLYQLCKLHKYLPLSAFMMFRAMDPDAIPYRDEYGWELDDVLSWEIVRAGEKHYVVINVIQTIHDITSYYEVTKYEDVDESV